LDWIFCADHEQVGLGVPGSTAEGGASIVHLDAKLPLIEVASGPSDGTTAMLALTSETSKAAVVMREESSPRRLCAPNIDPRSGNFLDPHIGSPRAFCLAGAAAAHCEGRGHCWERTLVVSARRDMGLDTLSCLADRWIVVIRKFVHLSEHVGRQLLLLLFRHDRQ
jgi:hypothetical protein